GSYGAGAKILEELEGPPDGRAWFARHRGIVPDERNHYTTLVTYVKDYFNRTFLSFCCKRVQVMEGRRFIVSDKGEGTESVVEGFSPKNPDLPWRRPRCNIAKFVLV